jgi:hypothetical protein
MNFGGEMKKRKGVFYIRRANFKKDKGDDFRTVLRLRIYQTVKQSCYVLVRHGYPHVAMMVGITKKEIKNRFFSPTWEVARCRWRGK